MQCSIDPEQIQNAVRFHGHSCPGLAIGIRASELAIQRLGLSEASDPVCVVETDMCAVDAIQFLTGCTFGKGNLVHRDYGKSVFTFFDRVSGTGFRALFQRPEEESKKDGPNLRDLMTKVRDKTATPAEQKDCDRLRQEKIEAILEADLESLFKVQPIRDPPVRPARILDSLVCEGCGEMTMESRIRRLSGSYYCIPCFQKKDQKV